MRAKDERAFSGASLLLAEDEPLNADIASRTLGKLGCRAAVASDGLAAVRMWQEGDFDLVLMDCEMPGMDGFEAVRQIRRLEAESNGRRTPIVALTAHAPQEIRERCLAAGMDDVLAKPFRDMLLRDTLAQWIDGARKSPNRDAEQAPPSGNDGPGVDRHVLESTAAFQGANGRLLLKNLVNRFAETANSQRKLMRGSHGKGDIEAIRRIAHTLKSSSAALGAMRVSRCCGEIEIRAGQGDAASLPGLVALLEEELSLAIHDLREIAAERKDPDRAAG